MCDTLVSVTSDGVLFAKNSDRPPNEAQVIEWHPAVNDDAPMRQATYVGVAATPRRHAVLLSRPWWMFGAEMGANEHGVVIGNEAVYTTAQSSDVGLLGMDLLRLALERATSAHEAVSVIVSLLERYGQGGDCAYDRPGWRYDNSFIVADRRGALVLETAGQHHAVEEVLGARSISNGLTIAGFAEKFARPLKGRLVGCQVRRRLTEASARTSDGPGDLMAALRDHGGDQPYWKEISGGLHAPCVHAGGLVKSSQTTSSMVVDLRGDDRIFMTGTSSPCCSLFKRVEVNTPLSLVGTDPGARFDASAKWWRHEPLRRRAIADWRGFMEVSGADRRHFESRVLRGELEGEAAFEEADRLEASWGERFVLQRDTRPGFVRRQATQLALSAGIAS